MYPPVIHDDVGLALLRQNLGHLLHLLFAIFNAIDANVPNQWDASTHRSSSTTLAVLNSNTFAGLHSELLAGVEIDLGVWLGRRRVQAGGCTVDMLVGEVVHDVGFLETGNHTRLCTGADNAHWVSLLLELLQLLWCTRAWLAFLAEFLCDSTEFLTNVVVKLLWRHGEVVLLLKTDAHATEVLPNEVFEEGFGGIAGIDVVLLHDLIGQVGTSLEGKMLAEA